jgi:hypothetical protein
MAWRDGGVASPQQPLDQHDLAHVIALVQVAEELQQVPRCQQRSRPLPQVPPPLVQLPDGQHRGGDRERNAHHV